MCASGVQKAPDITREALEESNPLSEEAVDLFLAIIGAEAGYMGVRALASGGVYICGGITPRVSCPLGVHGRWEDCAAVMMTFTLNTIAALPALPIR